MFVQNILIVSNDIQVNVKLISPSFAAHVQYALYMFILLFYLLDLNTYSINYFILTKNILLSNLLRLLLDNIAMYIKKQLK